MHLEQADGTSVCDVRELHADDRGEYFVLIVEAPTDGPWIVPVAPLFALFRGSRWLVSLDQPDVSGVGSSRSDPWFGPRRATLTLRKERTAGT